MIKLNVTNIKDRIITLKKAFTSNPPLGYTQKSVIKDVPANTYLAYSKPLGTYYTCKKACIAALNQAKPREKVFILDASNKIVGEFNGTPQSCNVIIPQINKLRLLHGHPLQKTGKTLPISLQDFLVFNDNPQLIEIVAFDINGNESRLIKNTNYKKLSNADFRKLERKYVDYLIDGASNEKRENLFSLIDYYKKHSEATSIKQSIADLLTQLQYEENAADSVNKFWLDYAKKINLTYIPYTT